MTKAQSYKNDVANLILAGKCVRCRRKAKTTGCGLCFSCRDKMRVYKRETWRASQRATGREPRIYKPRWESQMTEAASV